MLENIDEHGAQVNFIELDERLRERAPEPPVSEEPVAPTPGPAGSVPEGTHPNDVESMTEPLAEPPERVKKRYLRAGHQYFLKDEPHRLAFEDLGARLATEHNHPDIAESMMEMALAKKWRRIRVSGHDDFRREVWLQASLRGMAVTGYEPKPVDQARLEELRQHRMTNRIEPMPVPSMADPVDSVAPARRTDRAARAPEREVPSAANPARAATWAGQLLEEGRAPYQHNPGNSASHYVIYRDDAGLDHIVWGVDLERAIGESGARIGDAICLESLGRRWVTVEVPVRDDAGTVISVEEKQVYRNTWQVEVIGRDKASESMKDPSIVESRTQDVLVARQAPSRTRGIRPDHERARAADVSPPDKALHLTVIVEAMRAQGFSAKSIAQVQARAVKMLDTFQALGVEVPVPKVYDVKAPSTRGASRTKSDEVARPREKARVRAPSEPALPRL